VYFPAGITWLSRYKVPLPVTAPRLCPMYGETLRNVPLMAVLYALQLLASVVTVLSIITIKPLGPSVNA
jgi:hypothetical protein